MPPLWEPSPKVMNPGQRRRRPEPLFKSLLLMAMIVLFNSNAADLPLMADKRLLACAIGIAISLGVMALAHPIEQRFRAARGGEGC